MIRIELKEDTVTPRLDALARHFGDLTPVMQEIGEFLVASTKDRFQKGVSPDGAKWAPKSNTTKKAYERRKETVDARPLFGPSGMLSSQIGMLAGPTSVEVGSNRIYAAVMQFGAPQGAFGAAIGKDKRGRDHFHSIPWGDIPARPFLGISDEDRTGILKIVEEWLMRAAGGEVT